MGSPDIDRWILDNTQAGHSFETLLERLVGSGWPHATALEALEKTLGKPAVPVYKVGERGRRVTVQGHPIEVVMTMASPPITLFRHLLSEEECDALIKAAEPRLTSSCVVSDQTGDNVPHDARVSDGMFFQMGEMPLLDQIEDRIADLVAWPKDRGEAIQVLRYNVGGKYDPHYDYFNPAVPGSAKPLQQGGNRVGTLIMVLQAPEAGGGTVFPDVGLELLAQKGDGIFFSYDRPHPSTKSLHGGAPVVQGVKWIATKWLRQRATGGNG